MIPGCIGKLSVELRYVRIPAVTSSSRSLLLMFKWDELSRPLAGQGALPGPLSCTANGGHDFAIDAPPNQVLLLLFVLLVLVVLLLLVLLLPLLELLLTPCVLLPTRACSAAWTW